MTGDDKLPSDEAGPIGELVAILVNWLSLLRTAMHRWRVPLIFGAAGLFFIGLALSINSLDLRWDQISAAPMLLILLFGAVNLALASISLQLTACAIERRIDFRNGLALSAIGSIAELLPLPGGAMVRGAALMRAGAGLGESTRIMVLTAMLTLAMAAVLASVPLIAAGSATGHAFLASGTVGTVISLVWIMRRAGPAIAVAMIATRLGILALGVARVSAAFAAIGLAVGPVDAALFVISATLGTTVAIVPGGLGVSEAVAAALATLVAVSPPAAFVAVALNRVLGLCVSGIVALTFVLASTQWRSNSP